MVIIADAAFFHSDQPRILQDLQMMGDSRTGKTGFFCDFFHVETGSAAFFGYAAAAFLLRLQGSAVLLHLIKLLDDG